MGEGKPSGIVMLSTATRQAVAVASAASVLRSGSGRAQCTKLPTDDIPWPRQAARNRTTYHDRLCSCWRLGILYLTYRSSPATDDAAAVCNPGTGGFAVSHTGYGLHGVARGAARHSSATGRYGRSASVQGWYRGRTAVQPILIETVEGGAGT